MSDQLRAARQRAAFLRQTLADAQRALFHLPLYKGSPLAKQVEQALSNDDPFGSTVAMLEALAAFASGGITEAQACALLGLDPGTLRSWQTGVISRARQRWEAMPHD